MKFLHFVIIIQNQFSLRRMEKATLQLWALKPTKILPAALSFTVKSRTEWTILHQATPDLSLKLWQISGVAAHDELSASYHIHRRAWYYACCGLHRICTQKSSSCWQSVRCCHKADRNIIRFSSKVPYCRWSSFSQLGNSFCNNQ